MTSAGVTPRRHPHPTTTPHTHNTTARTPYSVGQSIPPSITHSRLSPRPVTNDARSTSPNYFGLTVAHQDKDYLSSGGGGQHARTNWSPPTSNVRSAAAASPRVMPLDQNPEFDAFRRQSEMAGFNAVKLSSFSVGTSAPAARRASKAGSISSVPLSPSQITLPPSPRVIPGVETKFAETKQRSPKRLLSSPVPHVTDRPRRNSPAGFNERDTNMAPQAARFLGQDREVRQSLPPTGTTPTSTNAFPNRADTLPASLDDHASGDGKSGNPALVSPQFALGLLESRPEEILMLDVRVSTQYAKSRVKGALNLCIPTTLLKRPAYNTTKLADTFKIAEQKQKFEKWKSCSTIIVYDSHSSKLKDAAPCLKMLEKFDNEGWAGASFIIRGGFLEFSRRFPAMISHGYDADPSATGLPGGLPPVIGGCPMPQTENAANPFFGNIRQNMDLIGGVGQIALQQPSFMSRHQGEELPRWLKWAAESSNDGKLVSDKFLAIEQNEQKRMQQALSSKVSYGTPRTGEERPVQLAGIEKGAKNRYNNIWPYEHSRVKIDDVSFGECDYFNANYVKSQWSNKRYIATQGPIPATFNDFWNVVWQQDVRVIVMLTAEKENGQLKAHNYWSDKHYGSLTVHFHSEHRASLEPSKIHRNRHERPTASHRRSANSVSGASVHPGDRVENLSPSSDQPYVIVRTFTVSNSREPFERMREITQLHYSHWPDFGAPAHPAHLLGLVEQTNAVVRASQYSQSYSGPSRSDERPVIVHCSAGCGRTGTFCTVDSVIDMLKRQKRDGYLNMDHQPNRNMRQPTPMDIDPRSRQTSFAGASASPPSASKSHFSSDGVADVRGDEWLNRDDVDLIEKAVTDFRMQRLSMVQSLRQFVLCYESVLEWLIENTTPDSD